MDYIFLQEDLDHLRSLLQNIHSQARQAGKDMGESCEEGAETFHDNFAYEDGERRYKLSAQRFVELRRIAESARVVTPNSDTTRVSIGRIVTVRNEDTGKVQTFKIGSYMVLRNPEPGEVRSVSYTAPLARAVIGKRLNEEAHVELGGQEQILTIIKIE